MKNIFCITMIAFAAACCFPPGGISAAPTAFIGVYADDLHSEISLELPTPYMSMTAWVWALPSDNGMMCAEYRLDVPSMLLPISVTLNPDITVDLGLVYGAGHSVCFASCKTDWTWIAQVNCILIEVNFGLFTIEPHDVAGGPQFGNCLPGYPIEPAVPINSLWINCYTPARMIRADVVWFDELEIEFSRAVHPEQYHPDFHNNFILYDKSDPSTTIQITEVTGSSDTYTLALETYLVDATTYVLSANDVCLSTSCGMLCGSSSRACITPVCGSSELEFTFYAESATMLQSFAAVLSDRAIEVSWLLSSIDYGVEFAVYRSEAGNGFSALRPENIERDVLEFRYVDDTIENGREYSYLVEYIDDTGPHILFETEPIEVPSATLTLDQNYPNPFNPLTEMRFYLPENGNVRLDIFDVTGRKVRTLVNRPLEAGSCGVEWDGKDDAGIPAVSGVYFYRLSSGKATLSRKMVLMR